MCIRDSEGPAGTTENPSDEQALFLPGQVPVLQLPPPQRPGPDGGRGVCAERARRVALHASVSVFSAWVSAFAESTPRLEQRGSGERQEERAVVCYVPVS